MSEDIDLGPPSSLSTTKVLTAKSEAVQRFLRELGIPGVPVSIVITIDREAVLVNCEYYPLDPESAP
jgi:hypothetical protein